MTFQNHFPRMFLAFLCVIRFTDAQVTQKFDVSIIEESGLNMATNATFSINTTSPDGFSLIMEEAKTINMTFNLFCQRKEESFYLDIKSADTNIFAIQSEPYAYISCENAQSIDVLHENKTTDYKEYKTMPKNSYHEKLYSVNGTLKMDFYGVMIGDAKIQFLLRGFNSNASITSNSTLVDAIIIVEHKMTVFRRPRPVDIIFRVVIYFFLIFATLAFGCKLDLGVVKESLKKPIAPGIGLACQYIVMPLIGFGIAKVVTTEAPSVSLGIFVSACCPGGGASNIYTHLLNGDLSLSITMTAVSTVAALGMLPFWLYTLGRMFIVANSNVSVPFVNIITTLLVLIVPLFIGILIKYKFPKIRKIFLKIITPVTVVAIIVLLTVGIYSNLYIFKMFKPRIVLAGCLLPYIGYLLGGIISLICRQPWKRVKTIAIETGMQNTGIAIVLMMVGFPPPYGEIAAVAPIASGVMTPLPLFLATIIYLIYKRCNKEKYAKVPVKNGVKKENGEDQPDVVEEKLSTV